MSRLKVAVIGAGHLGRIHARLAEQSAQAELVGVADPSPASREQAAAACRAPVVADFAALADGLQAAIVAVPTRLHHRVVLDLVQRGIHVLVEKPIATTVAEADEMIDAARRSGVVLAVGHVERFNPVFRAVEPRLGKVRYIEAARYGPFSFRSTDIGAVLDLMIHDIELALWLMRAPVCRVEAVGATVLGGHEDLASARVEWADGGVASFSVSRVSFEAQRRLRVFSDEGMASLDLSERTVTLVRPSPRLRQLDLDALSPAERERLKQHFFEELLPIERLQAAEGNALADEQADFFDSVRHLRPPRVPGEQGRAALWVAEQIVAAIARQQRRASVDERPAAAATLRGPHWHHAAQRREAG
jgi:predicted dehydrogenase